MEEADCKTKQCFWPWDHKWSKWKQYEWHGRSGFPGKPMSPVSETRQRRTCVKCGFMQDKWIKDG